MSNALERGLDVLEILAERGDVRIGEVMERLDVSRATVFRIVSVLESRGYVEHVTDGRTWRLGRAIEELATSLDSTSVLQLAAPGLADLRATTRETVNLALLQRSQVVWAASFDGAHALRLSTTIGEIVPIHATAIGKAILSVLPEVEWTRLLPPEPYPSITANTRTSYEQLRADVQLARESGWALDDEESELSGVCVAAPIVGREGRPVGAISVSSVAGRLPPEDRAPLGRAVRGWCEQISFGLRSPAAVRRGRVEVESTEQASAS
jgi:DNA-binding IclR family transcriptional regulator